MCINFKYCTLHLCINWREGSLAAYTKLITLLTIDIYIFRENQKTGDIYIFTENQKTGDIYIFSENQKTGDIYIFSENQKTGDIYIFSENQKTGDIYIFRENQKTGDIYIFSENQKTWELSASFYFFIKLSKLCPIPQFYKFHCVDVLWRIEEKGNINISSSV